MTYGLKNIYCRVVFSHFYRIQCGIVLRCIHTYICMCVICNACILMQKDKYLLSKKETRLSQKKKPGQMFSQFLTRGQTSRLNYIYSKKPIQKQTIEAHRFHFQRLFISYFILFPKIVYFLVLFIFDLYLFKKKLFLLTTCLLDTGSFRHSIYISFSQYSQLSFKISNLNSVLYQQDSNWDTRNYILYYH